MRISYHDESGCPSACPSGSRRALSIDRLSGGGTYRPGARRSVGGRAIDGRHASVVGMPGSGVLGLQRLAGNAAVSRLFSAQRVPERVPPLEFIASSTQSEATRDYFPDRILAVMRQRNVGFLAAARLVASGDLTGHGEHATRSANLAGNDVPAHMAALAFAVSHYRKRGFHNLGAVAEDLRPGGLARRALQTGGIGPVTFVRNPTANEIFDRISASIQALGALAGPGRRRLTIFFDGHGGSWGMYGTDGERFSIRELMTLSDVAAAMNVQVVVVSNACMQGASVLIAERFANAQLGSEIATEPHLTPGNRGNDRAVVGRIEEMIATGLGATEAINQISWILHRRSRFSPHVGELKDAMVQLRDRLHEREPLTLASPALVTRIDNLRASIAAVTTWTRPTAIHLMTEIDLVSNDLIEEVAAAEEHLDQLVHVPGAPVTFDGLLHSE